ncbi:AAA family ATPase [Bacillus testis]|uniref:AAA family ATPase n=1 Tax=Bacillus testis TaxID=1622072 RepID=UPI00067E9C65|nr:MoxR family ATPase [Bacillus testis]
MIKKVKHPIIEKILRNIDQVMIGKRNVAELSLIALLSEGHVLLEDVPGVGKTMMVKALAASIGASFKRIQFTPDLLPSDVTGTSIYSQKEQEFIFLPGPIMGNIILADEINRTSPKTQSSLLEGMEEASVTVDGVTRKLEQPFFVMATQNPIEYEGTYPLPEAQLDRFLLKMNMGYPEPSEEIDVLSSAQFNQPIDQLQPVATLEEVRAIQDEVKQVHVDYIMKRYIVDLANRTRIHSSIYLGVSPRGSIALMKASQANALMNGRDYVIPDDIHYLAPYVFGHRMILKPEAKYSGTSAEELVTAILAQVPVPVRRQVKE